LSSRAAETSPDEKNPHEEHVGGNSQDTDDADNEGSNGDTPSRTSGIPLLITASLMEQEGDEASEDKAHAGQKQF
jgi:hypothetical protein